MLSPLDDYPVHQIAEPIRHVATSDRNFYDRYYFNLHGCSDELFLVMGLGQYPNLGTTDAFAVVLRDGVQRVVRASRELGNDRMDTRVGPLRIEVIEGLRKLRVICEPNEWGLTYDLAKPEDRAKMFGLVDSVAEFDCEGEVGYGLFEYLVLGAYARYGFKDFMDGAP
jgi:hypothetical protein